MRRAGLAVMAVILVASGCATRAQQRTTAIVVGGAGAVSMGIGGVVLLAAMGAAASDCDSSDGRECADSAALGRTAWGFGAAGLGLAVAALVSQ